MPELVEGSSDCYLMNELLVPKARFKDDMFYQESARYYLEQYQFRFLQDPYLFRDRSLMGTTWLFVKVPQDKPEPFVPGQS